MISVVIVDDSAVVRKVLTRELEQAPDIQVVGTAVDPYAARDVILAKNPDVITLDVEMPRMDGLTFLSRLMKHHPLPVVVVSSLTPANSENALRALELGAVEVIAKPGSSFSIPDVPGVLIRAIRAAANARIRPLTGPSPTAATPTAPAKQHSFSQIKATHQILALGASTGGPKAVEVVLSGLPSSCPPILVVQHMPVGFTAPFAKRLDSVCKMEVREARDGDQVLPGLALVAPGGRHMRLTRTGALYRVQLVDGPPLHYQRPAVDVLFDSVAKAAGRNAVGVLLTGMGADGAAGLASMREAGAHTLAESEETCVVYGMPREAVRLNAAAEVVPLHRMADRVMAAL